EILRLLPKLKVLCTLSCVKYLSSRAEWNHSFTNDSAHSKDPGLPHTGIGLKGILKASAGIRIGASACSARTTSTVAATDTQNAPKLEPRRGRNENSPGRKSEDS